MWRHERVPEFTVDQLHAALSRKIFKKVRHVGLTGGEPSLRNDFGEIIDTLVKDLPSLCSLSIITNCINPVNSERIIRSLYTKCQETGMQFGLVLSMDGIGPYHDRNRGVPGNYRSLLSVISFVTEQKIPFSLGYTITKNNVQSLYETYETAKANQWPIYFSIAEFIDRLDNQSCEAIQSFSDDERYELLLFFHKLMNDDEVPPIYRRSYWKNFEILSGQTRPIGCPYHKEGIVLSPELKVGHCAVKGKTVGSSLDPDITRKFFNTWAINKKHVKQHCDKCFHYHYQKSSRQEMDDIERKIRRHFISSANLRNCIAVSSFLRKPEIGNYVLIVGWYGTETVGDKAILATIMKNYANKGFNIVIASIYPFITERTLKELGFAASIIESESLELIRYSRYAQKVVMGGGPLMDLPDLKYPLIAFSVSHKYGHENVIYGCGIGPVKEEEYISEIKSIVSMSDEISLRDSMSTALCLSWFPEIKVRTVDDPSVQYIRERSELVRVENRQNVLACFLRQISKEYLSGVSIGEEQIASLITDMAVQNGITTVKFYSMHNFWVGNDDRQYARYFKDKFFSSRNIPFSVEVDNTLSTVDNTIKRMKSARKVLCMRFHSMVFAHEVRADYMVIDYTNGGKIRAFLQDRNCLYRLVSEIGDGQ